MGWQTVKLGDVCDVRRGTTITEKQAIAGEIPVVAGGLSFSYTHNTANRNGPVITVSGSGANAGFVNFWDRPIFASDCSTVQPKSEAVDIKYTFFYLKYKQNFINLSMRSGAAQPHVYAKDIALLEMPMPPLPQQKRIAAILDKAVEIKEKLELAITKLDRLTQCIFIEMFGDLGTNEHRLKICTIGDLLESANYGTSEKSKDTGTYPILRMNNITVDGELNLRDLKYTELDSKGLERFLVKRGDILFNRTNSPELVGKSALFDLDENYAYAGYLIRLRVNSEADPAFIAGFLNTAYAKRILRNMCKSIIGMANINAKEVQSIAIPKPDMSLQVEYRNKVYAIKAFKKSHLKALEKIKEIISSLQHQAFTIGFDA